MTKTELLKSKDVLHLVEYIVKLWNGTESSTYLIGIKSSNRANAEYERFNSLKEVSKNYKWSYSVPENLLSNKKLAKGSDMNKNEQIFNEATALLLNGKELNPNELELRKGSELILRWGGVYKNGNKEKVENTDFNLKEMYSKAVNAWNAINNSNSSFSARDQLGFTSNAGFTKVYSLILPDFVIYDSRVAVALAFIIDKFFHGSIPEILQLHIPSSRPHDIEMRRVNKIFRPTYQKDSRHFYSNCIASIILKLVIDKINESAGTNKYSLRDLEAALFMMGYDLRGHHLNINMTEHA